MAGGDDRDEPAPPEISIDGQHITIRLSGERFDGGRLPVSAAKTLAAMEAAVDAISGDLDIGARSDAKKRSSLSRVELVLVGKIGDGSAVLTAEVSPKTPAAARSRNDQQAHLRRVAEVVPIILRRVHEGAVDVGFGLDAQTIRRVAAVGQNLKENQELSVWASVPDDSSPPDPDDVAVVSRATAIRAVSDQDVSDTSPFFVTGSLRNLEAHGDDPGNVTLAAHSGLYRLPKLAARFVSRAARYFSEDQNVMIAVAGTGVFDRNRRLKQVTHVTDMQAIDRHFTPDQRLAELFELSDSSLVGARIDRARPAVQRAALATGRAPGLFLDEEDQIEARWIIRSEPDGPAKIVNVTFGQETNIYVFDRSTRSITSDAVLDDIVPGDAIALVIEDTVRSFDE
jgi:hypothetical protein